MPEIHTSHDIPVNPAIGYTWAIQGQDTIWLQGSRCSAAITHSRDFPGGTHHTAFLASTLYLGATSDLIRGIRLGFGELAVPNDF